MADRVCVAAITGAYGVRGDVRMKCFTAEPAALGDYSPVMDEAGRRYDLTLGAALKGGFSARLSGVTTKEAADALRGTRLYVPRERLPALPDDEFYHADLIGLDVVDTGGAARGRVRAVLDHGAGALLEIAPEGRSGTILLPFTQAAVPTVDIAAGRIVVDLPEGLTD